MSSESLPFKNGNQLISDEQLANQTLDKAESQAPERRGGQCGQTRARCEASREF